MGDYLCFVSCALTINTLSSFLSLDSFRKRNIISDRDLSGIGDKLICLFDKHWLPIIKRGTFFEIFVCILLIAFFHEAPCFYTDQSRFLLFLPQIVFLLFMLFTELVVFSILCAKSSFKNNRPYWIGTIEFIFIFFVFGLLDLFLPSLFDFISNMAFQNVKPDDLISPESSVLPESSDVNIL